MTQYLLRLYITGNSTRSQRAIANLYRICREELYNQYRVEIIDVLEEPQKAEDEKILVTPTLIKQLPPPLQRIIGDMSNTDRVLLGLKLVQKKDELKI
jgi:circadian clock protein KaiB